MKILIINHNDDIDQVDTIYLVKDNWNDFSFRTLFHLYIYHHNEKFRIGAVKIGFVGQTEDDVTSIELEKLKLLNEKLPDNYFSLGGSEYYENLNKLSDSKKIKVLNSLNDLVVNQDRIKEIQDEKVLNTSLFRGRSLATITNTFTKIYRQKVELTDFNFFFEREADIHLSDIKLTFNVIANSKPSSNIHAIIGRNGIGKTTILNNIIQSITDRTNNGRLFYKDSFGDIVKVDNDFFSTLLSVSFSAFDPFDPPPEQPNPAKGTCYYYIGLKYTFTPKQQKERKCLFDKLESHLDQNSEEELKLLNGLKNNTQIMNVDELNNEFVKSLSEIKLYKNKLKKWKEIIKSLESDINFKEFELALLAEDSNYKENALKKISLMSSGHSVVLLTLTRLVERVEEKSLVLIDEPESHLHPPLLSAFVRALSNLLSSKNGVAIIATHSPVVLQEIPKSCVWKINRSNTISEPIRPDIETFGENVGVLTRDVFGLEVDKSGFYNLLNESVNAEKSFKKIMKEYNNQIGLEGRMILSKLLAK